MPIDKIRRKAAFAAANIDHVGIRWRNRQRSDRGDWLAVKNRFPSQAAIGGLPDASPYRAEVVSIRLVFNTADSNASASTKGANHPPAHSTQSVGSRLLRSRRKRQRKQQAADKHTKPTNRGTGDSHRKALYKTRFSETDTLLS